MIRRQASSGMLRDHSVAQYIEKCNEAGVNVELRFFPADGHGISTNQNYIRVFESIIDYCEEHWERN